MREEPTRVLRCTCCRRTQTACASSPGKARGRRALLACYVGQVDELAGVSIQIEDLDEDVGRREIVVVLQPREFRVELVAAAARCAVDEAQRAVGVALRRVNLMARIGGAEGGARALLTTLTGHAAGCLLRACQNVVVR